MRKGAFWRIFRGSFVFPISAGRACSSPMTLAKPRNLDRFALNLHRCKSVIGAFVAILPIAMFSSRERRKWLLGQPMAAADKFRRRYRQWYNNLGWRGVGCFAANNPVFHLQGADNFLRPPAVKLVLFAVVSVIAGHSGSSSWTGCCRASASRSGCSLKISRPSFSPCFMVLFGRWFYMQSNICFDHAVSSDLTNPLRSPKKPDHDSAVSGAGPWRLSSARRSPSRAIGGYHPLAPSARASACPIKCPARPLMLVRRGELSLARGPSWAVRDLLAVGGLLMLYGPRTRVYHSGGRMAVVGRAGVLRHLLPTPVTKRCPDRCLAISARRNRHRAISAAGCAWLACHLPAGTSGKCCSRGNRQFRWRF